MNAGAWLAFADAVLLLHAAFVLFVVGGLLLIVIGNASGWRFINHLWFRLLHLAAILVVIVQTWFGIDCPLTILENRLRELAGTRGYPASFIEHWVGEFLFYDAPTWVFTLIYTLFGLLVIGTWYLFPPRKRSNRNAR